MKALAWRWALPAIQLAMAFAALIYAPYELAARYHVIGDDFMLLGYRSVYPPPILRFAYAINFPAIAAAYSVQFEVGVSARQFTAKALRLSRSLCRTAYFSSVSAFCGT